MESSRDPTHDRLTLGAILRAFLPALLQLLKLGKHKLRVLWDLAACGTAQLGANLFACPHCRHQPALIANPRKVSRKRIFIGFLRARGSGCYWLLGVVVGDGVAAGAGVSL